MHIANDQEQRSSSEKEGCPTYDPYLMKGHYVEVECFTAAVLWCVDNCKGKWGTVYHRIVFTYWLDAVRFEREKIAQKRVLGALEMALYYGSPRERELAERIMRGDYDPNLA